MDSCNELTVLKNFINCMPKTYRKRNINFVVVRDILMHGTSHSGKTSCIEKCNELKIDPFGYNFNFESEVE